MQRRQTGEGVADVVEILLLEDLLNRRKGLTRTLADGLGTLHENGAVQVVVADDRRCTGQIAGGELTDLNQFVVLVAYVVTEHILEAAAS